MGPVGQNPIQRTVRTAHLSVLMTVHNYLHNIAQNSSDNLPSYLQTTIIAHMLSREGGWNVATIQQDPPHHVTVIDILNLTAQNEEQWIQELMPSC